MIIVRRVMDFATLHHESYDGKMSESLDKIFAVNVRCNVIDEIVKESEVIDALDCLDIDPYDHSKLSDIIDPDHSGTVTILELIDGLHSLRGLPQRRDTVKIGLMVRSLQGRIEDLCGSISNI